MFPLNFKDRAYTNTVSISQSQVERRESTPDFKWRDGDYQRICFGFEIFDSGIFLDRKINLERIFLGVA